MQDADGDLLIVPQVGGIALRTEFGLLQVEPCQVAVVQRGIRFSIDPLGSTPHIRGYILEVFSGHFELPDLGPIGANGLANPHHFVHPRAEELLSDGRWTLYNKFDGALFEAEQDWSPFNVTGWRGNYVPYSYDLRRFTTINTVSWDHPDPSIFTVLTCKSSVPGTAIADFVIFPPRWSVAEHTFRPPYYHRNTMTEFMGLLSGSYDAKPDGEGFAPGGASLHPAMSPHGPDAQAFLAASQAQLKPERVGDKAMAFMFETSLLLKVSAWAMSSAELQSDYVEAAWAQLP